MAGNYATGIDKLGVIRAVISGQLDTQNFERFFAEARSLASSLGGNHLAICDLRKAEIHSLEVIKAARQFIEQSDAPARKVAILVWGRLETMQARFLEVRPGIRVFSTMELAESWLHAA
jgi:hypothetical protein